VSNGLNSDIRPPTRFSLLLMALPLLATAAFYFGIRHELSALTTAQAQRAEHHASERLARQSALSLTMAMALADPALVRKVAEDLLRSDEAVVGLSVELQDGALVTVGSFPKDGIVSSLEVHGHTPLPAEVLLYGNRPATALERASEPAPRLGSLQLTTLRASGLLTGTSEINLSLAMYGTLAAIFLSFAAVALLLRHRLLQLGKIASALARGELDDIPRLRGNDEISWIAGNLSEISVLVREQVQRVHGRNATLLRDVTVQEARIERLADFMAILVSPLSEQLRFRQALDSLAQDVSASLALLFVPQPGSTAEASASLVCATAIGVPNKSAIELESTLHGALASSIKSLEIAHLPALAIDHPWMQLSKRKVPLEGVISVPLTFDNQLVAVVVLATRSALPTSDLDYLVDASLPMAIAIANQQAYGELVALSRRLEEQNTRLAEQRDQLESVNRLRAQFVANMSHELRTPLNAILGYSELIGDEVYGPVNQGQREAVDNVGQAAQHLLDLVNQVLDLNTMEAGHMTVESSPCDLRELVAHSVALAAPLARDLPYRPRLLTPDSVKIPIETDSERVHQILTNLLNNAIKFTEHGSVTATIETRADGGAIVSIRDTGIGIAKNDLEMIFEEFRQVDGSSTRARDGVGLGLAISQRLATALGGSLRVESSPGKGSVFSLELPKKMPLGSDPSSSTDSSPQSTPQLATGS